MNTYCLFVCSDEIQMNDSAEKFIRIVHDFSQSLSIKLTHIDYTFTEDENETDIPTNESLFSFEAIDLFKKALETKSLSDLSLWSGHDDLENLPDLNLYSELVDAGSGYGYKFMTMSFPMKLISKMVMPQIFQLTSHLLKFLNHLGKIDYALLTTMDSSLRQTYFRGIFTSGLSDEEVLDIAMWENKYIKRKELARGLFWGNLLSVNHLRRIVDKKKSYERLENYVDGLHTTINGDDLFFMLPTINTKSDPTAIAVKTLLKEYGLIMEPDDNDREIVSRLVSR